MQLENRVSLILTPLLAIVIALLAIFSWGLLYNQVRHNLLQTARLELESSLADVERTQTGIEVSLVSSLNTLKLFDHYGNNDADFNEYAINAAFGDLAYEASLVSPGFQTLAILDDQFQTLSVINTQEFSTFDPGQAHLDDVRVQAIDQLYNYMKANLHTEGILAYERNQGLELIVLKLISGNSSFGDSVTWNNKHYLLAMQARPEELNQLLLKPEYSFSVYGAREFAAGSIPAEIRTTSQDEMDTVTLNTSLFQVKNTLGPTNATNAMQALRNGLLLASLVAMAVLIVVIRRAVGKQILQPIRDLHHLIGSSVKQGAVLVSRRDEKNEIDALSNQYLQLMDQVQVLASTDDLTKLPNRKQFVGRLEQHISRHPRKTTALLYLDLDRFKQVNDNYGHAAGDQVLKDFAACLKSTLVAAIGEHELEQTCVSRLAGDEFVVFLTENFKRDRAIHFANAVIEGFKPSNVKLQMAVSIGISYFPDQAIDVEQLIGCADEAMFEAKSTGHNRHAIFNFEIRERNRLNRSIESALETSITEQLFYLVYQPIFSVDGSQLLGAEALLRSRHPVLAQIATQTYINLAEANGSIVEIDAMVLNMAKEAMTWLRQSQQDCFLAINFSAAELTTETFSERITEALSESGLRPDLLELEVTETKLVKFGKRAMQTLEALNKLGVKVSLDDFGTGYNSFVQLNRSAISKLKIDRQFVNAINRDDQDSNIVDVIMGIASLYDMKVVAEGVETQEQLDYLIALGCHQFQGFLMARPMVWGEFQTYLREYSAEQLLDCV